MGIRFQCPNGHKINVKAFLAGKRALCPHCGAKVVVPLESEDAAAASAAPSTAASPAGNGAAFARNGASVASQDAVLQKASLQSASPQTASSRPLAATAAPVSARTDSVAMSPTFGADLSAAAAAVSRPAVAAPAALGGAGLATVAGDPIAEAPQAVWYVRPRSGGQFGPAPGDIFRQWIAQRRVTADSLVWRDGWSEWRLAAEVLPQLAPRTSSLFGPAAGVAQPAVAPATVGAAAESVNATAARYVKSRRSKASTVAAICILGLVAIALVGVLIWVLNRP